MNPSTYTFLILGLTISFFVWGKIRSDLIAIISMLALFVGGVLSPSQALSGFSNSTVVMIAALFVIGEGLSRTGITSWLSKQVIDFAGESTARILIVLMVGTAVLSAFISNTGTVATLLPATIAIAWSVNSLPSKLLIPLAYAANTGGLLTLTGTPPNIVVSDALTNAGFTPFGFFEYAYIGFPLLVVTIFYMIFIGQKLLPENQMNNKPENLDSSMEGIADSFSLDGKLFLAHIDEGSKIFNQTLGEAALGRDYTVSVLRINRDESPLERTLDQKQRRRRALRGLRNDISEDLPSKHTVIKDRDVLLLKGSAAAVQKASEELAFLVEEIDVEKERVSDILVSSGVGVAEVLITPRSVYVGKKIQEVDVSRRYGVQVLSILRGGEVITRKTAKLRFGDALLVRGAWAKIEQLRAQRTNFTIVGSPDDLSRQVVSLNWRAIIAAISLIGMVVMMVTGIVPTVIATLIAAVVMVLSGCLDMNQAYKSIGWQSVVLIAAMIPLSIALDVTGGAELIANGLVDTLGAINPLVLMAGVFLLTSAFSQMINNTATAVLMAPIVLQAASVSGLSPYPLLITVSISASTAFLTPVGTTTNLMVMTPGGYSFNDYLKVGTPLMLIFLAVSLVLVPIIWPF